MSKDIFPPRILAILIVAVLACLSALPGQAHAQQTSLRASVVVVPRPEPVELMVAPSVTAGGTELAVTAPRSWRWQVERVRDVSSGERVVLGAGSGSARFGFGETQPRVRRATRSEDESDRRPLSSRASASPAGIVYTLAPI